MNTNDIVATLRDMATPLQSKVINEMIDDVENKLNFADAVIEETGVDIVNDEVEHQLGTVWVGDIAITGVKTEEL
jgi:hypothetical protein